MNDEIYNEDSAERFIKRIMIKIVEDNHPLFTPIQESFYEKVGIMHKDYIHLTGKIFTMRWFLDEDNQIDFLPATKGYMI